ncbi:hypothetical protein AU15_18390 [Marinobacter salarius]|uniref:Uncharacterized protein n=1 Tax=Marinobacter salarius TaxID=1420917 RepID=W5YWW3_9GAMM|nr:hypothetical protein AU15_18390 [Marinobacter salarius]
MIACPGRGCGYPLERPRALAVTADRFAGRLHHRNSLVGASPVEDDIASEPEHLAKKRDPYQRRLAYRDGAGRQQIPHHEQVIVVLVIGNNDRGPVLRHVVGPFQRALHAQEQTTDAGNRSCQQAVVVRIEWPGDIQNQCKQTDDRHHQPGQQFSWHSH